ncbi:MAG: tetratricopeptide repeat protein [Planctomycetes bacterium]|nr:tetratricopeptide repeat protein [Planctomycetota bacterium]
MFSDIQGSTALWNRLGDAFKPALDLHNRVLRDCFNRHNGFAFKSEGDSFKIAFERASDAVRFCLEAQVALHQTSWSQDCGELLVRMGAHLGEPIVGQDPASGQVDYFGPPVNKVARISSAAHGGQILCSSAVLGAARTAIEQLGADIKDLGEHRLKGFERPEHVYQLAPSALKDRSFPPLQIDRATATNLTRPKSSFIGRAAEVEKLAALLKDASTRLVTLWGMGGLGKTRLSQHVGDLLLKEPLPFEGGVYFVELAHARTLQAIVHETAKSLGVTLSGPDQSPQAVANVLRYRKPLLLILDNFEQAVEHANATVGLWLEQSPGTKFLVTSRTLLSLTGERSFELGPLESPRGKMPRKGETRRLADFVSSFDSVRLFVERAHDAKADFELTHGNAAVVAAICSELEGVPLAIELAAARIRIMQPAQMLSKLGRKFDLLKSTRRDLTPRQQTLLGAIDWSYELLNEWQRNALMQLAVFREGFTLEAAEAVLHLSAFEGAPLGMDAVQDLREKSLIRAFDANDGVRFGLFATIIEYAEDKWRQSASPEQQQHLALRHARYYQEHAAQWDKALRGPQLVQALNQIDAEMDNLFAAQDRMLAVGESRLAAEVIIAAAETMRLRGPTGERIARLTKAVDALTGQSDELNVLRARLLAAISRAAQDTGDWNRAREAADAAVALASNLNGRSDVQVRCLLEQGNVRRLKEDFAGALESYGKGEEIARAGGDELEACSCIGSQGMVHKNMGALNKARECYDRITPVFRRAGAKGSFAVALHNLSETLRLLGDLEGALTKECEAEAIAREIGSLPLLAAAIGGRCTILASTNDTQTVLDGLTEAESIARDVGDRRVIALNLNRRAEVLHRIGQHEQALTCCEEAEAINRELGRAKGIATTLVNRTRVLAALGRRDEALPPVAEACALFEKINDLNELYQAEAQEADVLRDLGRFKEAAAAYELAHKHCLAVGQKPLFTILAGWARSLNAARDTRAATVAREALACSSDDPRLGVSPRPEAIVDDLKALAGHA